jgi:hypothetical protein
METLVNRAAETADERLTAPGLGELGSEIWHDVEAMIRAVKEGDAPAGDAACKRLSASGEQRA